MTVDAANFTQLPAHPVRETYPSVRLIDAQLIALASAFADIPNGGGIAGNVDHVVTEKRALTFALKTSVVATGATLRIDVSYDNLAANYAYWRCFPLPGGELTTVERLIVPGFMARLRCLNESTAVQTIINCFVLWEAV